MNKLKFTLSLLLFFFSLMVNAQSMHYDKTAEGFLVFHPIKTDKGGKIIPWIADKPNQAYTQIIHKLWNFWDTIRVDYNGLPYYMNHQVWLPVNNDGRGIGGDQIAQSISSWQLLYQYTGNERVKENLKFMAEYYVTHSLSAKDALWPNLPYPYNSYVYSGTYSGDMILGKGFTQPDKAGSFALELIKTYKLTGETKYIDNAIDIANTLAINTKAGDSTHSPMPFKVQAQTGEIGILKNYEEQVLGTTIYTSNWAPTLQLYQELIKLNKGKTEAYQKSFDVILAWMKAVPLKQNKWGPFFEDVPGWSDTQINAITFARFMLQNPALFPNWKTEVPKIFDWVYAKLGNKTWQKYGVTVVNEQTSYPVPGNSHTARQAATELFYAQLTGDTSRNQNAIRQLNWATYMVDFDGKNNYPRDEVWFSDGYVDYIRHYLRAMASLPALAPNDENHILNSTSIIFRVDYAPHFNKGNGLDFPVAEEKETKIFYKTYDRQSEELIKLTAKPKAVYQGNELLPEQKNLINDGWIWDAKGGLLRVKHSKSNVVMVR
jgi:hypothetical protein